MLMASEISRKTEENQKAWGPVRKVEAALEVAKRGKPKGMVHGQSNSVPALLVLVPSAAAVRSGMATASTSGAAARVATATAALHLGCELGRLLSANSVRAPTSASFTAWS